MASINGHADVDNGAGIAVTIQPARELTELEKLHLQMNATTDASLDSTRRMVQYTQAVSRQK